MKLSEKEQEQLLTDYALAAKQYMLDVGAIREADNVEPVWVRTEDICGAIGVTQAWWKAVREQMIDLGIPLALAPRGGYYIGKPGEQASLIKHKSTMLRGIARSCNEDLLAMARDGKTMDEVEEYARTRLSMELKDIPKMLRALSCPLPPQVETRLIAASIEIAAQD